jgi:hypothetical protein
MPPSPPPLWDGYGDAGERSLIELLNGKIAAAQDDSDDTVDERVTRDLAQAIASHEWLKRKRDDGSYFPDLHAHADQIRRNEIGSWRRR